MTGADQPADIPRPDRPADGPPPDQPADGSSPGPQPATGPPDEVLDCLGQRCPLPVIAMARRLPQLPAGAVLRVLADDPAAANDIPAWCRMRGQQFLGASSVDGSPAYDVRHTPR